MNKKIALVLVLFILMLCGCEKVSGTVADKYIIPAHNEVIVQPSIVFGSNGMSTAFTPSNVYLGDAYILVIENEGKQTEVEVVKDVYDSIKVGDFFQE